MPPADVAWEAPMTNQPRRGRVGQLPTIYDVARECGVAPSTVSRAFSRPGRVNAETAERIRVVAARLGYRTNPPARALSTGRSSMIALVIPDVTNPVYFDITRGAEDAAAETGYTLLLADFRETGRLEREAIDRAVPAVEGLVLAGPRISDSAIRMAAKQRPTVILNRAMTGLPSVVIDNPRGMRRAAEHLGELGHTAITYLAGPEASWADGMRWRSLREACLELDLQARRLGPRRPAAPAAGHGRGGLQRPDGDRAHARPPACPGAGAEAGEHRRVRQHLRLRLLHPRPDHGRCAVAGAGGRGCPPAAFPAGRVQAAARAAPSAAGPAGRTGLDRSA
jgi:Bacterial regulatory proteins, lacI family/Periplasmic binding proteins and sugar binding domain of LacI family